MREKFGYDQAWSPHDTPREQVWRQNCAEEVFDRICDQAKLLGLAVSPVKRTMRTLKDEDGRDWMVCYYQRASVEGKEWQIQYVKEIIDKKRPPIFAEAIR